MSQQTSDPSRIERDLDRTRSRLGSHLSELQDRLSPGQVVDDLMGYFRGSEGAAFSQNLLASVRANPLPAALTGIGLAWLMASNPRGGAMASSVDHGASIDRVRVAEQGVVRYSGETEEVYAVRLDEARGEAMGVSRHSQETSSSYSQRIRDALSAAQQAVAQGAAGIQQQVGGAIGAAGGAIGSVAATMQGAARSVGSTGVGLAQQTGGVLLQRGQAVGQMSGNLMTTLSESPVLLGALGLAAGALLGALLPHSDQEEAALGGLAGQARDTVRNLANQAMEQGGTVMQTILDKGSESVKAHGLDGGKSVGGLLDAAISGELAGDARQVVGDVLGAGDEAVRKAVLDQQPASKPT